METLSGPLPILLTVTDKAAPARYPSMKRVMHYKKAVTVSQAAQSERTVDKDFLIEEWNLDKIGADPVRCGMSGSPTAVKRIQSIVLTGGTYKEIKPNQEGVDSLIHELIEDHTIG
jgi:electron transfer flavoprotein beta subunit